MYLETLDRRSLFHDRSLPGKTEAFPFEDAVRKDSAVHVSLSSDSPVKQPRKPTGSPISKVTQGADEAKAAETYRWPVPLVNGSFKRRAVAPMSARRAVCEGGYMAHDVRVSTPKTSKFFQPVIPRESSD